MKPTLKSISKRFAVAALVFALVIEAFPKVINQSEASYAAQKYYTIDDLKAGDKASFKNTSGVLNNTWTFCNYWHGHPVFECDGSINTDGSDYGFVTLAMEATNLTVTDTNLHLPTELKEKLVKHDKACADFNFIIEPTNPSTGYNWIGSTILEDNMYGRPIGDNDKSYRLNKSASSNKTEVFCLPVHADSMLDTYNDSALADNGNKPALCYPARQGYVLTSSVSVDNSNSRYTLYHSLLRKQESGGNTASAVPALVPSNIIQMGSNWQYSVNGLERKNFKAYPAIEFSDTNNICFTKEDGVYKQADAKMQKINYVYHEEAKTDTVYVSTSENTIKPKSLGELGFVKRSNESFLGWSTQQNAAAPTSTFGIDGNDLTLYAVTKATSSPTPTQRAVSTAKPIATPKISPTPKPSTTPKVSATPIVSATPKPSTAPTQKPSSSTAPAQTSTPTVSATQVPQSQTSTVPAGTTYTISDDGKTLTVYYPNGAIDQIGVDLAKGTSTDVTYIGSDGNTYTIDVDYPSSVEASDTDYFIPKDVDYEVTGKKSVKITNIPNNKSFKIKSKVTIDGKVYKVTAISKNAAKNCKKLQSVTIPASISKIGQNAFKNCKKLKYILIYSTKLKIGKNAFKGISKKAVFDLTGDLDEIKALKKQIRSSGCGSAVKFRC